MRIGLVLHPYGDPTQEGSGGKFTPFIEGIINGRPDDSFVCYLKGAVRDGARFSYTGRGGVAYKFLGTLSVWLTGALKLEPLDLYIFLSPVIPMFFRPKRSIVVVQDFAYLSLPPTRPRDYLLRPLMFVMHKGSLKKASLIIAISQATKDDVVRHFGIPAGRVRVMHLGFTPPTLAPVPMSVQEPFFLYVGSLKMRKNVELIVRGFSAFAKGEQAHSLVLTGKQKGPYYELLASLVRQEALEPRIQFVGRVSDAEVAHLYSRASALVFPSLYEGFGFPIIEAMHWGCPVITSSEGALKEVAGDAALLVDPRDPASVAAAMTRLADDAGVRGLLIEKGKARAAEFTWDRAVAIALGAMRDVTSVAREKF